MSTSLGNGMDLNKWRRKRERQRQRQEERKLRMEQDQKEKAAMEHVNDHANRTPKESNTQQPHRFVVNQHRRHSIVETHHGKPLASIEQFSQEESLSSLSTTSPSTKSRQQRRLVSSPNHHPTRATKKTSIFVVRKRPRSDSDDSSSDESARQTPRPMLLKQTRASQQEASTGIAKKPLNTSDSSPPTKKKPAIYVRKRIVQSDSDDSSDSDLEMQNPTPSKPKSPFWLNTTTRPEESSHDDGSDADKPPSKQRTTRRMDDSSSNDDKPTTQKFHNNPIALEKQEQQLAQAKSPLVRPTQDGLWDDSGSDDNTSSVARHPQKKSTSKRDSSKENNHKKRKKKRASNNNSAWNGDVSSQFAQEKDHEDEMDLIPQDTIKPNPEDNAKFVPSQQHFCPLVLSNIKNENENGGNGNGGNNDGDGNGENNNEPNNNNTTNDITTTTINNNTTTAQVIQVPKSINWLLKEFQREGVQFMYQAYSKGQGCILGDDMGMGKTVQVMALLAALLQKTGTRRDLVLLKQQERQLEAIVQLERKQNENSMLYGKAQANSTEQPQPQRQFGPILVVVPPSVVDNWLNEFKTWGYFGVSAYKGSKERREAALERVGNGMDEILVIGSKLFQLNAHFRALDDKSWELVIVDEFHNYKNHKAIGHQCLQKLKAKHECIMIGLSGTIMPNEHKELFNLVNLVQPGHLGSWGFFKERIAEPIKMGRLKTALDDMVERGAKCSKELRVQLKPVLLERKKEGVQELQDELPMKDEKVVFCELSQIQKEIYKHVMTLPDYELLRDAKAPCECGVNRRLFMQYKRLNTHKERVAFLKTHKKNIVCRCDCCFHLPWNPKKNQEGEPKIHPSAALWKAYHKEEEECERCPHCLLLPALTKLYKVCSHAASLQLDSNPLHSVEGSKEREKLDNELAFAKVALPSNVLERMPGGSYVREDGIMDDHKMLSGKMEVLDEILKSCSRRNDRVLIFSYSTKTLSLIQNFVRAMGYSFLRIDGATPTSKRQGIVDQYSTDETIFLFLLSTKACGLGLNITAANVVVVFDVNWNPSLDEQAQDRAYRIGQKQDVKVIRLVSRGTIEELMYVRQVYKVQLKQETLGSTAREEEQAPQAARLFRGVAGDKTRKGELFGIENLLKYKDGSFMASIWKASTNNSQRKRMGNVQLFDTLDLSNAISEMTEEQVENIGSPELDETFERVALEDAGANQSSEEDEEEGNMNLLVHKHAINHEDFLRSDRGEAALQQGDDGFEEEMGGESQVVHDALELAEIDNAEGEYDSDTQPIVEDYIPRPDVIPSNNIIAAFARGSAEVAVAQRKAVPNNQSRRLTVPRREDQRADPASFTDEREAGAMAMPATDAAVERADQQNTSPEQSADEPKQARKRLMGKVRRKTKSTTLSKIKTQFTVDDILGA